MSLTLKTAKGKAVFAWSDGPMAATWTVTEAMDEGEIMEALLAMVKFIRVQPGDADVIPLHSVEMVDRMPKITGPLMEHRDPNGDIYRVRATDPAPMGWTPAIKPTPLSDLHEKIQGTGFELIEDDDDLA